MRDFDLWSRTVIHAVKQREEVLYLCQSEESLDLACCCFSIAGSAHKNLVTCITLLALPRLSLSVLVMSLQIVKEVSEDGLILVFWWENGGKRADIFCLCRKNEIQPFFVLNAEWIGNQIQKQSFINFICFLNKSAFLFTVITKPDWLAIKWNL